jgi:hypothetical protein
MKWSVVRWLIQVQLTCGWVSWEEVAVHQPDARVRWAQMTQTHSFSPAVEVALEMGSGKILRSRNPSWEEEVEWVWLMEQGRVWFC